MPKNQIKPLDVIHFDPENLNIADANTSVRRLSDMTGYFADKVADVSPENVVAMFNVAREFRFDK